ncbi:hypothetical protein C3941_04290 [Kaistia algarum]|uniref:M20/M25/M40 family metallo-hydrolase n=1 Tax=Kaistia algarum TaxID=2083279 RepID=UPI000CE8334E|nr:M20/M25/M40 family metallo-hydrolase [Kaistia algarum]MCX5512563.1 M20/M25/M40 family metallo-hydrolase [Kaistia algarum]PPE81912.1 hypothetical protein C3941_04290 [Kaistia algarum]
MDSATQAALNGIDNDPDGVIGFLQTLIRLQPQGEAAVQAAVAARLAALGARVDELHYEPSQVPVVQEFASESTIVHGERTSVVGTFEGVSTGRSLILFAHPDGEPIGDVSTWQHDPFAGAIDGGRLHGWGVADDLAGVAAGISAMEAIRKAGIALSGDVVIASTPSKRHARGVAAVLHHGWGADGAIYLHPAESGVGMQEIKALASGQLIFTVDVMGRSPDTTEPGHTAFAHLAIHPFGKAKLLIDALRALDAERATRIRHPLLDAAVGRSTNILISALKFGEPGESTRVPTRLSFTGAISFPPPETLDAVQAEVEAALEAVIAADPFLRENRPTLRWLSGVTGTEVPATHPLYVSVSAAIQAVSGTTPHVNAMHTSSDIRNPLVQKGIPTVGLGPLCGDLTQTGRHDEWVDVEDYLRTVKVTAASIIAWCGAGPTDPPK